jgi:hypothetical protein
MGEDRRPPVRHIVAIDVLPDGQQAAHFQYSHAVLHMYKGDDVKWESAAGPFVIQFQRGTPLGRVHHYSVPSNARHSIGPIPIPQSVPAGRYSYAVAMYRNPTVYIDAGCPEIIIED